MTPIPYDSAAQGGSLDEDALALVCPACSAEFGVGTGETTCPDCGYVPKHGAD